MPFFVRQASPTQSALRTGFAEVKTVAFAPVPVTSISRPLTNPERWALYHFETHAASCSACHKPYKVHRAGGRLCTVGHQLAQDVAKYIYTQSDGAHAYSVTDRLVRVEVPANHPDVLSLLRAIEHGLRHTRQRPIVSLDRNYPIAERRPTRTTHLPAQLVHAMPSSVAIGPRYEIREPSHTIVESSTGHQTVYPAYSTEVREPKRRSRSSMYNV